MKLSLDRSKCVGHAMCNAVDPELFPLDDSGYSTVEPYEVKAEDLATVEAGVGACPEKALILEDS
ncbi:ferredoxin [Mycolicibacterium anyangense]|uniref:Ferredoxin n=1 Tax=Mycolicibacterium anyangense TaxID=1431246 RepID=A0A6N4WD18_9MYCO|nr:ferredoxin [Mycolicibacterium anyangense]BBZ77091.1 ferredoxin [Mycolicibacterium anyangense]